MEYKDKLPATFIISVNLGDFQETWDKLVNAGVSVSPNPNERYAQRGRKNYIKYCRNHGYIWASGIYDESYLTYVDPKGFFMDFPVPVEKNTHQDIVDYLTFSEDVKVVEESIVELESKKTALLEKLSNLKDKLNLE